MVTRDTIHSIIKLAVLAPSSHNTQPWRFRVAQDYIDLLADRTRALPVNDPFDRELVISCGAALLTLRAAAASAGLGTQVMVLPDAGDADWLARVNLTADPANAALADLAAFIKRRRTYRRAFDGRRVAPETMAAVAKAAELEGAKLHTLDDEQRTQAGELVAEGDRAQWNDSHWRRELALWMHPSRDGDGLTVPLLTAPIAQAVVRLTESRSPIVFVVPKDERTKDDPQTRQPDITVARRVLGWEPTVELEEGLARSIPWFRGQV